MTKENIINILGIASLFFCLGISFGEHNRGKSTFFRSWISDSLYYGEKVKIKEGLEETHFYNSDCKKRTIIGLQSIDNSNLAWVLLESCSWTKNQFSTDTFNQNVLEKDK